MEKKLNYSKIPREEFLSLNLKELKATSPNSLNTKLILSKGENETTPMTQRIIKPWLVSLSKQIFVSRNKIGESLLQNCRHGFLLDDPNIIKSRFYVDYHRLHDPALKRYYNSVPVRNRLKKLGLVNSEDDAECTPKELVEYLEYLDRNLTVLKAHTALKEVNALEMLRRKFACFLFEMSF